MILDAERASAARFSGHGSALAQVYNHIIMPLASTRDAITQIRWGIADFEHPLRPQARRHVARRDRRQPRGARPDGRAKASSSPCLRPSSAPGCVRSRNPRRRLDSRRPNGHPSIRPSLTWSNSTKAAASRFFSNDGPCIARHCLRRPAGQRPKSSPDRLLGLLSDPA